MANKSPHKVGDRIAIMPNGHSLVPGIILTLTQAPTGNWRGDVRTADGVLENCLLHSDFVLKESAMQEVSLTAWGPIWERLEKATG
jgi:hypothetical protein